MNINRLNLVLFMLCLLLTAVPGFSQISTVGPDTPLNVQDMGIRGFTVSDAATLTNNIISIGNVTPVRMPAHPAGARGVYVYSNKQLVYGSAYIAGSDTDAEAATVAVGQAPLVIATTTSTLFRIAPGITRADIWFVQDGGGNATSSTVFTWIK